MDFHIDGHQRTPYEAVWGTVLLADGQYLFRAIITDAAGNSTTLDATPVTVDTTAPAADIAAGSLEPQAVTGGVIFYTHDRKPLFGALAADAVPAGAQAGAVSSGVAKVEFLYAPFTPKPDAWDDFSLISSDLGSSGFAAYNATGIPVAGMPEGDYYWAVRATDRAGNASVLLKGNPADLDPDATQRVVVDYTAPVVSITAPLAGASLAEGVVSNVTWTLTDTSPPNSVLFQYSLDNGATWLPDPAYRGGFRHKSRDVRVDCSHRHRDQDTMPGADHSDRQGRRCFGTHRQRTGALHRAVFGGLHHHRHPLIGRAPTRLRPRDVR